MLYELEKELRERTQVNELISLKVRATEEGRETVEKINSSMSDLLNEMRDHPDMSNEISQAYTNVRYDLKTARHNIQYQMMRLTKVNK
jgi:hypothetical protein